MSFLLEQKYRYSVFEPVDNVRSQLKSVLKTPWYDIDVNLAGSVSKDNTFKLYPKFSMGIEVFGVIQGISVITGRLEAEDEKTHIHMEVRPNYVVLLAFYLILLIFIFKLFGLFTPSAESDWILLVGLFILLIFIRSLIHLSMGRLRERFEKKMSIYPED